MKNLIKSNMTKTLCKSLSLLLVLFTFLVSPVFGSEVDNNIPQTFDETPIVDREAILVELNQSISLFELFDTDTLTEWNSSDSDVVTIDNLGHAMPISEGSATITATNADSSILYKVELFVINSLDVLNTPSIETANDVKGDNFNGRYTVTIDPGHGGSDPGAVAYLNGQRIDEKDIALTVSKKVQAMLSPYVDVVMTRTDDSYVGLAERAVIANNAGSDAFVSIHANSFSSSAAYGIETYYTAAKSHSRPLAEETQSNLISYTGAFNRGVKTANFVVTSQTNMPAILAELGFMSNPSELAKLVNSSYQDKLAQAIAEGVLDFLGVPYDDITNPGDTDIIMTGTVSGVNSVLNVRSSASSSSSIVGTLSNGSNVDIVDISGNWYKILYNGGFGYVHKDYISLNNNSGFISGKVVGVNSALNVRSSASSSSSILGSVPLNSEVSIISTHDNWFKIAFNGGTGYVSGNYIDVNGSLGTGTVTGVNTSLNVRSSYSGSSSIIGSIPKNTAVHILDESNGWYKILYGNGYGYVSSSYINRPITGTVVGVNSALNVRSSASGSSTILGSIPKGGSVSIVETLGGWFKIDFNGKTGYVSSQYVNIPGITQVGTIVNVNSSVNVRSSASSSSTALGTIPKGATVHISSKSGNWYKIMYGTSYAYVHENYVSASNSTFAGTVTASSLNVRSSTSTSSSVIGTLYSGNTVAIVDTSGEWYKINYGNGYGYVHRDYVRV